MRRGEVWWASLPVPSGSSPGFRRPVLIVQANSFNDSRIGTVIVAAITSNLKLGDAPGNVRLAKGDGGVPKPCVVNVSQLLTADRAFLGEWLGSLAPSLLQRVDEGLRLVLELDVGAPKIDRAHSQQSYSSQESIKA